MSEFIKALSNDPIVSEARSREAKEYFGQGWSHYPTMFDRERDGIRYSLLMYNTPNQLQVNWSLHDSDMPWNGAGHAQWPLGESWTLFALTTEESITLAERLGLPIGDWLAAAMSACASDVNATPKDNVVDLDTFHAARSFNIEEVGR